MKFQIFTFIVITMVALSSAQLLPSKNGKHSENR